MAAVPSPTSDPESPAVVILNEAQLSMDQKGHVQGTVRHAVRVLRLEGRAYASARIPYRTDGGAVRELKAWMLRAAGEVIAYGKGDAFDMIAVENDVYNEARVRVIHAAEDADVGSVFGYETSFEERDFSGQFQWHFQDRLPVGRAALSIVIPEGWNLKTVTFNRDPIEPEVAGSTYSWEVKDLSYIKEEPGMPPAASFTPRLGISAFAPPSSSAEVVSFHTWEEVAGWLEDLAAPSSAPDQAIAARAQTLAANARTELERIRAIARYVQDLNYVSIQMGLAGGGGYRPHPATEVFAKSYGDCKDKANLMKTMLRCIGIESYMTAICSDDPTYVRQEWPAPHQFNHCILAIRVESDSLPGAIRHPRLGPLLLFDPTDPETPLGDLPEGEQGGWALLISKEAGMLVRAPVADSERNRMEREIEAELDSTGSIRGAIREWSCGQQAVKERRAFHHSSVSEYQRRVESWVSVGTANATVSKVSPRDDPRGSAFELRLEFNVRNYAQLMGEHLMIFKPALVSRSEHLWLTAPKRRYPVVLEARSYRERSSTKLPFGFTVEELPKPVTIETPFGSYSAQTEARDGELLLTRSMRLKAMNVPIESYEALRSFFERIRTVEMSPVVLARK